MIETHYVPLQPPYRIVYSGGAMGLQIGTLLVAYYSDPREDRPLGNRTHRPKMSTKTHPVVSYLNKNLKEFPDSFITRFEGVGGNYSEAVVWDQVDQSEVLTVCLEGQSLLWEEFLHLLDIWIHWSRDEESAWKEFEKARSFVENLLKLGGKIQMPVFNSRTAKKKENVGYDIMIPLHFMTLSEYFDLKEGEEGKLYIGTGFTDQLPMGAPNPDFEVMYEILSVQQRFYRWFFDKINPEVNYDLHFIMADPPVNFYDTEPTEEELEKFKDILDKLNGEK